SVHYVGNNGNGEEIKLSKKPFKFKDETLKDLLMHYFLTPFKSDVYFHLKKTSKGIFKLIDEIFKDRSVMHDNSKDIAKHLFDQSVHPKVKGGEFYMAYFSEMTVDGELCDAIGIFKSENRETFLRVLEEGSEFDIESEKGININKLDKGALIFQTEKDKGYKVSMIDFNAKSPEVALYWQEDFLHLVPREDAFYHTQNFIEAAKGFCEEVLTEENNVPKAQQMAMLNKSVSFFKDRDHFSMNDFKKEVMPQASVQKEFKEYHQNYIEENNLTAIEDFDVSQTAFKKNQKYLRSVIKLDKNFHIYVHSKHEFIEKGFDEERGMKFYKVYFENEE
ncbi:MAG: nucleoid-associated protein, partial [Bacteroidia bacterium]|nr:nucleoid-associated protein [Bacteroidia bacterium]